MVSSYLMNIRNTRPLLLFINTNTRSMQRFLLHGTGMQKERSHPFRIKEIVDAVGLSPQLQHQKVWLPLVTIVHLHCTLYNNYLIVILVTMLVVVDGPTKLINILQGMELPLRLLILLHTQQQKRLANTNLHKKHLQMLPKHRRWV